MAIAVPIEEVDELLEQARALDDRAESLRKEARLLGREAGELRVLAQNLSREPVKFHAPYQVSRDSYLRARILRVIDEHGPCATSHIAEHLDVPQDRVRVALGHMRKAQVVKRCGLKRGTIWARFEDESIQSVAEIGEDARSLVRDAARRLGTFTFADITAELPMLSDQTLRRWLPQMESEGVLDSERVGKAKLYAYARPEGETPARPKREAPERAAIVQFNRRQGPVIGTGKQQRSASPIVNELLRELRANHPQIEIKRRSHKFAFYFNGEEISSCSTTPGASALGETRRKLRQAGVMVAA